MSKKKNRNRTPGIPASALMGMSKDELHAKAVADVPKVMGAAAGPAPTGTVRFEHEDGTVEAMPYWDAAAERAHIVGAINALEG